jgi:ribosomal protein L4
MKNLDLRSALVHRAVASTLFGCRDVPFKGTPREITAAAVVVEATQNFINVLSEEELDKSKVVEAFVIRSKAMAHFESVFGFSWIL